MKRPVPQSTRAPGSLATVAAPADRRFRRAEGRGERRRWIRVASRLVRWGAPLALLTAAAIGAAHLVLHSPLLSVRRVVVSGNVRLSAGEVQALADGLRGESILRVDLERYRRRLMDSPWVAGVALWRRLPSTIQVRIVERTPMVIARLGQRLFLVDDTGVIIDEYTPAYRDFDLPIVDGLLPAAGTAAPVDPDRVRLTADLVAALAARPDLRRRLSQIDVTNPHDAMVMFDNEAAWLHLGDREFLARLLRYLELAPTLKARFQQLDYVDLRFDERVFVRSRPPAARRARG